MILIGQYDSPFVRRVAITLQLYGFDFEHQPWSVFRHVEAVARFNPLLRVPVLQLDDGEVLVDSSAILDHLDELAGPERALLQGRGAGRRRALQACAQALFLCEKSVSLVYERVMHEQPSASWTQRCVTQVTTALKQIETALAARTSQFWLGERIGHEDIALAVGVRFIAQAHAGVIALDGFDAIAAHLERCETLPAFRSTSVTFSGPGRQADG